MSDDVISKSLGIDFIGPVEDKSIVQQPQNKDKDEKNLDVDFKQIKTTEFLPNIKSKYQMVGVLYVLEGSVLGATMLYSKIIVLFGEEFKNNLNYLYGYGKDNFVRWKHFLKFLDELQIKDNASKLEIIDAAKDMFNCFANEFKCS